MPKGIFFKRCGPFDFIPQGPKRPENGQCTVFSGAGRQPKRVRREEQQNVASYNQLRP
jgi:hypothetical protein